MRILINRAAESILLVTVKMTVSVAHLKTLIEAEVSQPADTLRSTPNDEALEVSIILLYYGLQSVDELRLSLLFQGLALRMDKSVDYSSILKVADILTGLRNEMLDTSLLEAYYQSQLLKPNSSLKENRVHPGSASTSRHMCQLRLRLLRVFLTTQVLTRRDDHQSALKHICGKLRAGQSYSLICAGRALSEGFLCDPLIQNLPSVTLIEINIDVFLVNKEQERFDLILNAVETMNDELQLIDRYFDMWKR